MRSELEDRLRTERDTERHTERRTEGWRLHSPWGTQRASTSAVVHVQSSHTTSKDANGLAGTQGAHNGNSHTDLSGSVNLNQIEFDLM